MENFYETASNIQFQLPQQYKHPKYLMEVLRTTVEDESFYQFVERIKTDMNPMEYYQICLSAISKQAMTDSRMLKPTLALPSSTEKVNIVHHCHNASCSSVENSTSVFIASGGRRYGNDNRHTTRNHYQANRNNDTSANGQRKNPMKNGEIMKCREC